MRNIYTIARLTVLEMLRRRLFLVLLGLLALAVGGLLAPERQELHEHLERLGLPPSNRSVPRADQRNVARHRPTSLRIWTRQASGRPELGQADAGDYPQLSSEFIVSADPDLIFLADTKCCHQSAATVGKPITSINLPPAAK